MRDKRHPSFGRARTPEEVANIRAGMGTAAAIDARDDRMRELWLTQMTKVEIGRDLGITKAAVQRRGEFLSLGNRPWVPMNRPQMKKTLSPEQLKIAKSVYPAKGTLQDTATLLGVSYRAVQRTLKEDGVSFDQRIYTSERVELLRVEFANGTRCEVIIDMLNALPGHQVSRNGIYSVARRFKMVRGKHRMSLGKRVIVWTPQRDEVIQTERPKGASFATIRALVNALPGPHVTSDMAVRNRAGRMRIAGPARVPELKKPRIRIRAKAVVTPPPICVFQEEVKRRKFVQQLTPASFDSQRPETPRLHVPQDTVALPPPNDDGVVEAELGLLMAWTRQQGLEWFDGSNMDRLGKVLAFRKLPPVVVVYA